MRVNIYRVTNMETDAAIEGTAKELEEQGYSSNAVKYYSTKGGFYLDIYKCEFVREEIRNKPKKTVEQKKKHESLEEVERKAKELGMTYGEYMAVLYLQMTDRRNQHG